MFGLNLWERFVEPQLDEMIEKQAKRYYEQYEENLHALNEMLSNFPRYDIANHLASFTIAYLIEQYTSKEFSWLRQAVYYFAIYSYVVTFSLSFTIDMASVEIGTMIDKLHKKYGEMP